MPNIRENGLLILERPEKRWKLKERASDIFPTKAPKYVRLCIEKYLLISVNLQ